MRLSQVAAVCEPGDAHPCEDTLWAGGDLAFVMDGASAMATPLLDAVTGDAAWFVATVTERLRHRWAESTSVTSALRDALADTAQTWSRLTGAAPSHDPPAHDAPPPLLPHRLPSAGLALVAIEHDDLVLLRVGDCELHVVTDDGTQRVFDDPPLRRLDERALERMAEYRDAGLSRDGALAAIRPMLIAHRDLLNDPAGYPALSVTRLDGLVPEVRRLPAHAVRRVLLTTDGFSCSWQSYALEEPSRWLPGAGIDARVAEVLRRLRGIEEEDRDGLRHPRFARHDDATALVVDLTA